MGKTLFLVPRMYTDTEFKNLATSLPDDFKQKTDEFWIYVNERLKMFSGKISRIYRDHICKAGEEALSLLYLMDRENYEIVKGLVENGASLIATEDSILVGESEAWAEMLRNQQSNTVVLELFQQNLEERIKHISNRIDEALEDNEIGVLFIEPNLRIELSKDIKIIRMCRFDPSDYLKSWQVQEKLKFQAESQK